MFELVRGIRLTILGYREMRVASIKQDCITCVTLFRRPRDQTWVLGVQYWTWLHMKFAGNAWQLRSIYRETPDFDFLMSLFDSVSPGDKLSDLVNSGLIIHSRPLV